MAKKPTITKAQWREAETLAVQGTKYEEIALRFGIAVVTLRQRARTHDWQTPGRIARKKRMADQGVVQAAPETVTKATGGKVTSAALVPHQEALRATAGVNPKAFQNALANWAEALIAEGAPNIPPPRSVAELNKLNDLYRKASGLDGNHASGRVPFIRVMPSLRRGPAVEAEEIEADPLDGFVI
jgi:hypothetical protein